MPRMKLDTGTRKSPGDPTIEVFVISTQARTAVESSKCGNSGFQIQAIESRSTTGERPEDGEMRKGIVAKSHDALYLQDAATKFRWPPWRELPIFSAALP